MHKEHFRTELHKHPDRYSRHYSDVYQMGHSPILEAALKRINLLKDVIDFKKRFYPCSWARYDSAQSQTIQLLPSEYNCDFLKDDYRKMRNMIYDHYPSWNEILDYLTDLENKIHN